MKIAIYEKVHLELIISYADLLANEDLSVSFITSALFKNDLKNILAQKNPHFSWHFLEPADSISQFAKKIYLVVENAHFDLVIVNSIDSRHLIIWMILKLAKPKRILLNLHDINNFFKTKASLSVRTNIRFAGKKLLSFLTDGYIVNSDSMKTYIAKQRFTKKPVYWIPPVAYTPLLTGKKTASDISIVIAGSIDKKRRDYKLVLEVIAEMLQRNINVQWVLAGRPVEDYGYEIIEKISKLKKTGVNIRFYEEEIPENEFQEILANATLIFSPLVASTIFQDGICEVYGESKGSGNVLDVIRHAKPLVIPAAVTVPHELVWSCIFYESKYNLVEQLLKIFSDDSILSDYSKEAEKNSKKFSKERIINMFKAAIYNT